MHSPWPQVRPRSEVVARQNRVLPKPRQLRRTRLPGQTGAVYPRVRQYLFDLREPVDVRVLAAALDAPVLDVHQALKRLAAAGRAKMSEGLWSFIRYAERTGAAQLNTHLEN